VLDSLKVDELKVKATGLGLAFRSKATKKELVALLAPLLILPAPVQKRVNGLLKKWRKHSKTLGKQRKAARYHARALNLGQSYYQD